jgi:hypothetical protein
MKMGVTSSRIYSVLKQQDKARLLKKEKQIDCFLFELNYNGGLQSYNWKVEIIHPDGDNLIICHDSTVSSGRGEWAFGYKSGKWNTKLDEILTSMEHESRDAIAAQELYRQDMENEEKRKERERTNKFESMFI